MSGATETHSFIKLLGLAAVAGGAVWAWDRFKHPAAAPPHPDDVQSCLSSKPNWTLGQCTGRLTELRNAIADAQAQLAAITAGRAEWLALGNVDQVRAIDQQAAPWQRALSDHVQDYFNLTGTRL